jgi:cysteine-rich repeat protein
VKGSNAMVDRTNMQRLVFVGMTLVAASCAQIVGMEEGVLRQDESATACMVLDDCMASATECKLATACNDGLCEYMYVIRGTVVMDQTIGDCRNVVCDGDGATEVVVNKDDIEDDKNACTEDSCDNGNVVHTALAEGTVVACYEGAAGTENVGMCVAGTQACDAAGKPIAPCAGQVVPQAAEECTTAMVDENCNGMLNETGVEGGSCACADSVVSAGIGEWCDDGNVLAGDGCSPICSPETVQIAPGGNSTCLVFNDGSVKCWGHNGAGQLGIGSAGNIIGDIPAEMGEGLDVTPLGMGKKALKVAGRYTFCAILDDQTLRCWGLNDDGQLGQGNTDEIGDGPDEMGDNLPKVDLGSNNIPMDFAVSRTRVCAIMTTGKLKCWGRNDLGQVGVEDSLPHGSGVDQMGDYLPFINLGKDGGNDLTVKKVAIGELHTCAILNNDKVKCWGRPNYGILGLGAPPIAYGANAMTMGDVLPYVDLGGGMTAKAIAAGDNHTCVILNDDSVKCWGENDSGQLGLGNSAPIGDDETVAQGPAVNLGGHTAKAISAGADTTCVLLDDDSVKCWGLNNHGQLGLGDKVNRGATLSSTPDKLTAIDLGTGKVVAVNVGGYFVCALFNDSSVKCWGENLGRLGLGDTEDYGDEADEMGINLPTVKLFSDKW